MPEQVTTGEQAQPNQVPVTTDQPTQTTVTPTPVTADVNSTLKDTSDRTTEQFNKLLQHNRELFNKYQELEAEKRRLESQMVQGQVTSQPQVANTQQGQNLTGLGLTQQQMQTLTTQQVDPAQFVDIDPVTGERYVNELKLKSALDDARTRAAHAEQTMQSFIEQQQRERELIETQEAYQSFPELDPVNPNRDDELISMTSRFLLDSMVNKNNYGGVRLTFKQAAERAKKYVDAVRTPQQPVVAAPPAPTQEQIKQLQEEAAKAEAVKQQASAEVSSSSQRGEAAISAEQNRDLVRRTRAGRGDDAIWAIAQRLQGTPHTGTPRSSREDN